MALALWCAISASFVHAAVTRVELISRTDVRNGASFGKTGAYERIAGKVYFAVDPRLAPNRFVADIDLAPRDSRGLVEFSADLYVFKPREPAKGNGTALIQISNRGGRSYNFAQSSSEAQAAETLGDRFLFEQGYTVVWVGWEFDLPPKPDLVRAYLPIATDHGKTITGIVRSEWTGDAQQGTIPLGDRGQIGYGALDAGSAKNKLFVRDTVRGARTLIPHSEWRFSDATHVTLNGGFAPGRIYEVVYETKDPEVAGLGLAAVRDFVSFLKYGGAETALDDQHKFLKRAIAFGVSQSGRFLREYLYDGFNEDEKHRQVLDGVWAHVAGAGRGSFNEGFAQPSRDGHPFLNVFYPVDVPPFDEEGLLEKSRRAHVVPKLFLTNGGYEYWGRCASLIHTTADGKADAPPSANTRIYFFASSQHFGGTIPPAPAPTQNLTNTNDYRYGLRALFAAMQSWVKDGTEPPPSQFPRLSRSELTTIAELRFPKIPGVEVPEHKREAYRLDFSMEPPKAGEPFPTFVPQVDADGNDLGGIRMPEIAVPLASYTGWNLRSASIGAPAEMLSFFGSWIPFARDRQDRVQRGDPRLSVAERYGSEREYLDRIDKAAEELVRSGYVLEIDRPMLHERAVKEWEYRRLN
ncbi:MAG: alpha/beta hydrolase domain-containing protein [Bryobacteraceae bacterium]